MPGVTVPLGIRFPLQTETVDATSWQNMANDIDALLTTLSTIRAEAIKPEGAFIQSLGSPTTTPASNTDGVLHFSNVNWDTSSFANLGANDDRLTLSSGVYYCLAFSDISGFTTLTQARIGLLTGSTLWSAQSLDTVTALNLYGLAASGIVVISGAATALQVRCRWNGTGTAVFGGGSNGLVVYKIRELADV